MHIDRHYDLSDSFKDEDLEPLKKYPLLDFQEFTELKRWDRQFNVFKWDNYLRAGYFLHSRWFHTNIFLTHKEGDKESNAWGPNPLKIKEEDPLFMEWCIQQFIGEPSKWLDGFKGNDCPRSSPTGTAKAARTQ